MFATMLVLIGLFIVYAVKGFCLASTNAFGTAMPVFVLLGWVVVKVNGRKYSLLPARFIEAKLTRYTLVFSSIVAIFYYFMQK
jgi:hypothetical protein